MENGKAPIVVECPPFAGYGNKEPWGPAPPHMSSHWGSISGHLEDPPPRQNGGIAKQFGRKAFPERADDIQARYGQVVWGGAH